MLSSVGSSISRSVALEAVPERRLRQRLQQIHGQHRDVRKLDEILQPRLGVGRVGVEAENDAGRDFQAVVVERLDRFHHRDRVVVLLAHGLERIGLRRLDADEQAEEAGLAHQREDVRLLGDVERRLAGELHRIAVLLLPFDEMRQHLARGLAVADEIVVDEIDHRRMTRLTAHGIELGDDLLRRLQPRLAAVEAGDVAELAAIGTAAGELQRQHQVVPQRDQVVGRHREIVRAAGAPWSRSAPARAAARRSASSARDQPVGGVAELAEVQVVDLRIHSPAMPRPMARRAP